MRSPSAQQCVPDYQGLCFDEAKWRVYKQIMETARRRGVPFAVGGGLATMIYIGRTRDPKDLDLFLQESDREEMIRITEEAGLVDYYEQRPYDRSWIYRAATENLIVDVIWSMANHRAAVDCAWVERGPELVYDGVPFRLVPPEETLWSKLYILQHDRCDWPGALNLLYAIGPRLDWERLMKRAGCDLALLGALLTIFGWLSPDSARELPGWLWYQLNARRPDHESAPNGARADLLDTRPWFIGKGYRLAENSHAHRNHESPAAECSRRDLPDGWHGNGISRPHAGAPQRGLLEREARRDPGGPRTVASAIPEIRAAAVHELRSLYCFAEAGARWMNVHPDRHTPWHDRHFYIQGNLASFSELLPDLERTGIGLIIENLPDDYNNAEQLAELLDPMPELGLHLDIGLANLRVRQTSVEILIRFGARLRHVHLHDNKAGDAGLHLPLGTGSVNLREAIGALRKCGYDSTITLEVFTPDRRYLAYSRDVPRKVWDETAPLAEAAVSDCRGK